MKRGSAQRPGLRQDFSRPSASPRSARSKRRCAQRGGERQAQGQRGAAGQDDADRRRHRPVPYDRRHRSSWNSRIAHAPSPVRSSRCSAAVRRCPCIAAQDRPSPDAGATGAAEPADDARIARATACCGCCRRDSVSDKEITVGGRKHRLHGDRRHAGAVRSERRAQRRGVLHRLCRQGRRRRAPAGDLRVQWRAGRGLGLSASRPRGPAHRRIRPGRPRRRRGQAGRQSGHLARLHRSGDDRSGRHRLEPDRQARRRQARSAACGSDAECSPR